MIYFQLFYIFFKIGLFSFGGGYAILSLIQREVVQNSSWITTGEFTEIVALSQITPGPIAINSATYIGYHITNNVLGSVVSTFGVILPSVLIIGLILIFLSKFERSLFIKRGFKALRIIVLGLILAAGLSLLTKDNFLDYKSVLIFIGSIILSLKYNIGIIPLIISSGILGIFLYH